MSKLISFPLQGVQEQRFHILTSYVGCSDWWKKIFLSGACIAGGAAMFVADEVQCICDVGDVDIWMPRHVDMTPHVESLCKWLVDNSIDYGIRIQNHMVTILNPIINIQFISAIYEFGIAAVLDGFDYDCVQAAIYMHVDKQLRSGTEICTVHLLCSERAIESYKTRENKWINLRRWKFNKFLELQSTFSEERIRQREFKMQRKKFFKRGCTVIDVEKHVCLKQHRILSNDYWLCMSQQESLQFQECREKISAIHRPKRDRTSIDHSVEYMQSEGKGQDEIQEYILGFLEWLKLDEETFKTSKIQLLKESTNEWVLAPSLEDKNRLALKNLLNLWQRRFLNPTKSQGFAIRNLTLLANPEISLQDVKASILSDGLKCKPGCQLFATGLFLDSQTYDASVHSLLTLIERTFF